MLGSWARFYRASLAFTGFSLVGTAVLAAPVYFTVAESGSPVHGDSYVLPLEEPADIAHARDLIARGPEAAGATIAFAEIQAGSDGINRNVLAPGQPLWNWHVTKFEGFGDFGIELTDGWPSFVEGDVLGWISNTRRDDTTRGHIGFWSYTVVGEVGVPSNPIPTPDGLTAGVIGLAVVIVARKRFLKRP